MYNSHDYIISQTPASSPSGNVQTTGKIEITLVRNPIIIVLLSSLPKKLERKCTTHMTI